MKNKKYKTVGIIPKSYLKYVEKGKIDTPTTQKHDAHVPGFAKRGVSPRLIIGLGDLDQILLRTKYQPSLVKIQ